MSRFRNDTGGVLTVNDLQITVGPGERFTWDGHDPEVHGLPTGCTWLDAPDAPKHQDRSAVHSEADPEPADPDAPAADPDAGDGTEKTGKRPAKEASK